MYSNKELLQLIKSKKDVNINRLILTVEKGIPCDFITFQKKDDDAFISKGPIGSGGYNIRAFCWM